MDWSKIYYSVMDKNPHLDPETVRAVALEAQECLAQVEVDATKDAARFRAAVSVLLISRSW